MMSRTGETGAMTGGTQGTRSMAEVADTAAPVGAGFVVSRLARQMERALVPSQLSLSQYRILGWLGSGSAVSSMLADKLAVTPPSITGIVDGLVGRGLVERQPDPDDRRRQQVTITSAGRRAFAAADTAVDARLTEILHHLEADDARAVMAAFELFQLALERRAAAEGRR